MPSGGSRNNMRIKQILLKSIAKAIGFFLFTKWWSDTWKYLPVIKAGAELLDYIEVEGIAF